MSKIFKGLFFVLICIFALGLLIDNISEKSSQDISNTDNKETSNLEIVEDELVDDNLDNENINKNSTTSDNVDNKVSSDDSYNILISSSVGDKVVSFDSATKELKVKDTDNKDTSVSVDNYINLSDEDIEYFKENADTILSEFENGNLFEKYELVNKFLKDYDTDISTVDIINLALKYIK